MGSGRDENAASVASIYHCVDAVDAASGKKSRRPIESDVGSGRTALRCRCFCFCCYCFYCCCCRCCCRCCCCCCFWKIFRSSRGCDSASATCTTVTVAVAVLVFFSLSPLLSSSTFWCRFLGFLHVRVNFRRLSTRFKWSSASSLTHQKMSASEFVNKMRDRVLTNFRG